MKKLVCPHLLNVRYATRKLKLIFTEMLSEEEQPAVVCDAGYGNGDICVRADLEMESG